MESKEFVELLRKKVRNTQEYKSLERQKNMFIKAFRFVEANNTMKLMADLERRTLDAYISNYEGEVKKVSELIDCMSDEDRDKMNVYGNMLVMMCDVLETSIIEMNQLLKKYHPTFNIETFDEVKELGVAAKTRVRMLDDNVKDQYYTNTYGTHADKLFEMCYNKAKSFISKIKKHNGL